MFENYDVNMCWSCDSVMNMMIDITPKQMESDDIVLSNCDVCNDDMK